MVVVVLKDGEDILEDMDQGGDRDVVVGGGVGVVEEVMVVVVAVVGGVRD